MAIGAIGGSSGLTVHSLVEMRRQLDELQRQLGTGRKSETYAGMGLDRGLAVGLRSSLSALEGYDNTITNVGVRINLAQSTLGRLLDIGRDVKSAALQGSASFDSSGQTVAQVTAYSSFGEILGLLNTRVGDRYLFSGRATDQPAVDTLAHIMDGDGSRAGFKQVIDERRQADLGADGLGRLVVTSPTATSVSLAEDVDGSPFGFKLASITSTLTGATITGPTGSPPAGSVDLGATNPNAGETIQFRLDLPDGTSESIALTATTDSPPGTNEFTIGATSDVTAANLQAALTGAVGALAGTALTAASAMAASENFFAIDDANPPLRVAGPPFDTATVLVAGTPSDTVMWYSGEAGSDPARGTATARIDESIGVSYGMRANEEGLRRLVQNVAVLAATTLSPTDPNAADFNLALSQRTITAFDGASGQQKIADIEAELAGAQASMQSATERHRQVSATLADMVQQIEGVPTEDVAARILALQTRLQASLQTTSLLFQTSLVNYI